MTRRFIAVTIGLAATVSFLVGLIVAGTMTPTPATSAPDTRLVRTRAANVRRRRRHDVVRGHCRTFEPGCRQHRRHDDGDGVRGAATIRLLPGGPEYERRSVRRGP